MKRLLGTDPIPLRTMNEVAACIARGGSVVLKMHAEVPMWLDLEAEVFPTLNEVQRTNLQGLLDAGRVGEIDG